MFDSIGLLLHDAIWSAVAASGFAILFNVPRLTLPFCALLGAIGHATRTALVEFGGMPIEPATLLAAIVIGVLAKLLAMRMKKPSMIFSISAAIPMVPGLFAYGAMIGIFEVIGAEPAQRPDLLAAAAVDAIKTGLILLSLAAGIVLPSLLFEREKPVV